MYYYYPNAHDHHHAHHYWSPSPDPYTTSAYSTPPAPLLPSPLERVARLAAGSAVVIFSSSGCCMCHAVKRLLRGMGVSPVVHELDMDPRGVEMEEALGALLGDSNGGVGSSPLPVVFVGGRLLGSMDRVMGCHISGELVPLLKEAGALWL